jgi:uncharacterized protein (DUF2249 family)
MEKPNWLQQERIKITLDARPVLAAGEHPLARVMDETKDLVSGEIYEMITPFTPVPLIEKVKAMGFDSFTSEENPSEIHTYFHKI